MEIRVNKETKAVQALFDDGQILGATQYAAVVENHFRNRFQACSEHELMTTFYGDLSIAEYFGEKGIRDTFASVCKNWLNDYKYFAEFVLCLNWKIWAWHDLGCRELSMLYDELWKKADAMIWERYEGNEEACSYIFHVLD